MARCNECNRFRSGEVEVEDNGLELLDGKEVSGSVTFYLNCEDCGTTMKEAEVDVNFDLVSEHRCEDKEISADFDVTFDGEKTVKGRKVYTATITASMSCECGATWEETEEIECEAGEMDEC